MSNTSERKINLQIRLFKLAARKALETKDLPPHDGLYKAKIRVAEALMIIADSDWCLEEIALMNLEL